MLTTEHFLVGPSGLATRMAWTDRYVTFAAGLFIVEAPELGSGPGCRIWRDLDPVDLEATG